MKHEGAELQTQPDVVVWGVCVHHASEGEGEGEGGEEGGAGGGTLSGVGCSVRCSLFGGWSPNGS